MFMFLIVAISFSFGQPGSGGGNGGGPGGGNGNDPCLGPHPPPRCQGGNPVPISGRWVLIVIGLGLAWYRLRPLTRKETTNNMDI